jgi:hypothetical protein
MSTQGKKGAQGKRNTQRNTQTTTDTQRNAQTELSANHIESIAKAIHDDYRRHHSGEPYDAPWEDLPEDIRRTNRDQAAHIAGYAGLLGLTISDDGESFRADGELTDRRLETAAKAIHEVWAQSKKATGWKYGATRDDEKKRHPMLIPYAKLPEAEKEKDRAIARNIVPLLKIAGFSIIGDRIT